MQDKEKVEALPDSMQVCDRVIAWRLRNGMGAPVRRKRLTERKRDQAKESKGKKREHVSITNQPSAKALNNLQLKSKSPVLSMRLS